MTLSKQQRKAVQVICQYEKAHKEDIYFWELHRRLQKRILVNTESLRRALKILEGKGIVKIHYRRRWEERSRGYSLTKKGLRLLSNK